MDATTKMLCPDTRNQAKSGAQEGKQGHVEEAQAQEVVQGGTYLATLLMVSPVGFGRGTITVPIALLSRLGDWAYVGFRGSEAGLTVGFNGASIVRGTRQYHLAEARGFPLWRLM